MGEIEVGDTVVIRGEVESVSGMGIVAIRTPDRGGRGESILTVSRNRIAEVIKAPRKMPTKGWVLAGNGRVYERWGSYWRSGDGVDWLWSAVEDQGLWQELIPESEVESRRKEKPIVDTVRQPEPPVGSIVESLFGWYTHSMPGDLSIEEAKKGLYWINLSTGRRATWDSMTGSGMRTLKVWLPEKKGN